ncbi:SufE family protein [Aestuariivirga sp.]|uniref:SufE family protein n=1 Tax=Aestuariivirga sp. TaxID=2650926 RepID=UPI0037845852
MTAIDELIADFDILDDWEDRYRHVIELGRQLPELPAADHTPQNKVRGCASQVWITSHASGDIDNPVLSFQGDSDALIVKGLIAIAFMIFSEKPARQILATDAGEVLGRLGLAGHLTQQRSNGFASMIQRIKQDAATALQASPGPAAGGIAGR